VVAEDQHFKWLPSISKEKKVHYGKNHKTVECGKPKNWDFRLVRGPQQSGGERKKGGFSNPFAGRRLKIM